MLIDATLKLADAQASTQSAASTSYIDTLRTNVGAVKDALFVVTITTAVTASSTGVCTFDLRHDTSSAFGTDTVLVSSGAIPKATLVAGYQIKLRIPHQSVKRYMRGYTTIANDLLTGAWDMDIVLDADQKIV